MAYKPNKAVALIFSIAIIIFGVVMAKRSNPDTPFNGRLKPPPLYFDIGLVVVGVIGIILIWLGSRTKY